MYDRLRLWYNNDRFISRYENMYTDRHPLTLGFPRTQGAGLGIVRHIWLAGQRAHSKC
ncbi:hypothetical protein PT2222_120219 [Paraburkholderia tropica]